MALLIFIAILIALIWVHELGHFSVAKFFKVRVDEFAIGFPPRLLTVQWGETRYSFNLILIGGYVSIYGENPGEGDDPRSLARKNRAVQASVMFAGIVFNILAAWLILSAGFMGGMPIQGTEGTFGAARDVHAMVGGVLPESPAAVAGLMAGDTVRYAETGSTKLPEGSSAAEVQAFITEHADETILLHVTRGEEDLTFAARPAEGIVEGRKALGVQLGDAGVLQLPVHLALLEGAVTTADWFVKTVQGMGSIIGGLFSGGTNVDDVAGPIGIATIGTQAVQTSLSATLLLTALISINLAVVNLLPIPGLDGGRLFILLIESIIRRPISPKVSTWLTLGGFAFILVIFVLASINDISRLVG